MAGNSQSAERSERLAIPLPLDLAVIIYAGERVPDSLIERLTQDVHAILIGWQYSSWTSLVELGGRIATEEAGQGRSEAEAQRTLDARPDATEAEGRVSGEETPAQRRATLNLNRLGDISQAIKSAAAGLIPSVEEYERNLEQGTGEAIAGLLTDQAKIEAAAASLKRPERLDR